MSVSIQWLPKGHVTHGYRRVFAVYENNQFKHIVNLSMMPYESVYQIQQLADTGQMTDPALWWGLSFVVKLLKDPAAFEDSDDGYIQLRPQLMEKEELLSMEAYTQALQQGVYIIE
ncbi:hypothetical protein LSG31_23065 [Fodinisporobacter ferrooxydans]|uniref:Uncharacterized protein n=1 Tax=Fodinisporobacter ferrooxydans TaxID=2901836 RepID=A0ABY4CN78_9BACL|nr:hypothetical protein LSG31_23065 [Alicyclobacillaceae bacterium MYW30-H2]